ncbi:MULTISPECIES: PilZ domain-containing protein [Sphingobium]|uniref:Pilus assembly protein PilZ n=1 Tax=Sphingobium chungbukense TaxID=56193 RepID=A0A0M3ANE1_9SPHN|nr:MULTISPECIES: PilZ domain-containing protein [Sphingobium]KKW90054.1 pilus assembly protein PilZ [Sphingobium chungbukense]PJG49318.1 PilZ domain-containing protein [Sphingobium sp. LB126]
MPSVFANLSHLNLSRDPSINQRRVQRDLVDMVSHITAQGRTHGARIINISALGLMCRTEAPIRIGERLTVWLPVVKDHIAEVRWAEDGRIGIEFIGPIEPQIYDAMLSLIPPRQTAW